MEVTKKATSGVPGRDVLPGSGELLSRDTLENQEPRATGNFQTGTGIVLVSHAVQYGSH